MTLKKRNIFKTAYGIKFKPESNIMGLDFNGHVKTFDKRGWISNLFLPKTIADKFKDNRDDDKIFEELNKISPAKIQHDSSAGTSRTDDIYKEIRENSKEINKNNDTSGSGTGILAPVSTDAGQTQQSAKPLEELVKDFYSTKTEKLTNLKDLLLAFYVKAKELNNFRAWAKVSSDLDYQLVLKNKLAQQIIHQQEPTFQADLKGTILLIITKFSIKKLRLKNIKVQKQL